MEKKTEESIQAFIFPN